MNNNYKIIALENTNENIQNCAKKLNDGFLVAFPTETVYGLGANSYFDKSIEKIYTLKNRPKNNPLITHFYSIDQIKEHCIINETFLKIAVNFMPGPISVILHKKENSPLSKLSSSNNKIAVRIPNNSTALKLIQYANNPIVAPSANVSNKLSPTKSMHVLQSFKNSVLTEDVFLLIDDNASIYGLESSVVEIIDNNSINILRHGGITVEEFIQAGFNVINDINNNNKNNSPGLLKKHYSPNTPLILNSINISNNEGLLAFGNTDNITIPKNSVMLNLSKNSNLQEAAKNLFSMLWQLDELNLTKIHVMAIPNTELGVAINERLLKAAYK